MNFADKKIVREIKKGIGNKMGLAATQTRFLSLTARKSNIEYQGQQINQQRTVLSNKSANLYSEMLTLSVPVPPSTSEFTTVQYIFTEVDANGNITGRYQTVGFDHEKAQEGYEFAVLNTVTNNIEEPRRIQAADQKDQYTNRWKSLNGCKTTVVEVTDNAAYQDSYNQYLYKQYLYEQEMESINAKTEVIQQQDKALELQLSQLDTEQNELKTEMEALDKVLGDNVESSYKTFGG